MQLKKGADVFSSAGEKIGSIDRVVIDPETKEASHLVVEKGVLFTTNKVISDETVALKEGAKVISKDGEHIGNVEEVIIETAEDVATHIVVSKGFFLKDRKLVPSIWISDVDEDQVILSVWSDLFDQLPEYESET